MPRWETGSSCVRASRYAPGARSEGSGGGARYVRWDDTRARTPLSPGATLPSSTPTALAEPRPAGSAPGDDGLRRLEGLFDVVEELLHALTEGVGVDRRVMAGLAQFLAGGKTSVLRDVQLFAARSRASSLPRPACTLSSSIRDLHWSNAPAMDSTNCDFSSCRAVSPPESGVVFDMAILLFSRSRSRLCVLISVYRMPAWR